MVASWSEAQVAPGTQVALGGHLVGLALNLWGLCCLWIISVRIELLDTQLVSEDWWLVWKNLLTADVRNGVRTHHLLGMSQSLLIKQLPANSY